MLVFNRYAYNIAPLRAILMVALYLDRVALRLEMSPPIYCSLAHLMNLGCWTSKQGAYFLMISLNSL
jgi:hypothetical protein